MWICRPNFSLNHLKINILDKRWFLDIKCLIHGITFGIIFFPRYNNGKHKKANKIHMEIKWD